MFEIKHIFLMYVYMLYDVLFQSNLQHGLFFLTEGKKIDFIIPYNSRGSQKILPNLFRKLHLNDQALKNIT